MFHAAQQHAIHALGRVRVRYVLIARQIWRYGELGWQEEEALAGHTDWVRDVAWAPNIGLPKNTIASCGQDGQVRGGICAWLICTFMGGRRAGQRKIIISPASR